MTTGRWQPADQNGLKTWRNGSGRITEYAGEYVLRINGIREGVHGSLKSAKSACRDLADRRTIVKQTA